MTAILNFSLYALIEPVTENDYTPHVFEAKASKSFHNVLMKNKLNHTMGLTKSNVELNSFTFAENNQTRMYLNAYVQFSSNDTELYIECMELPGTIESAFCEVLKDLDYREVKERQVDLVDITFE